MQNTNLYIPTMCPSSFGILINKIKNAEDLPKSQVTFPKQVYQYELNNLISTNFETFPIQLLPTVLACYFILP